MAAYVAYDDRDLDIEDDDDFDEDDSDMEVCHRIIALWSLRCNTMSW